jgi:hypothetical protein
MPDICMCADSEKCPLAPGCYRSELSGTKPDEYRQTYAYLFADGPKDIHGDCADFMPVKIDRRKPPK